MQKFIPNKTGLWFTTSLVVIGALFYALSFFLLQDQVLTTQIRNNLQKTLKKTGLKIEIKNIHWSGWGSFQCSNVLLTDEREKSIPAQAEKLNISFDLLDLLKNRSRPLNALREVELINPSLRLRRFSDGTWDIQNYFPKSKQKLRLQTVFIIKNGSISLNDDRYGKHSFKRVNGKAQFYLNNTFDWDCTGISDFNNDFQWSSRGNSVTNFKIGHGEITVTNLLLSKIAPYLPEKYSMKIHKGTGKFDIKFGWHKGQFWFENGTVTLNDTRLEIPNSNEILDIMELDGSISPTELKVQKARLVYNGSLLKVSGRLDTKTTVIDGMISGDRVNLADLPKFFPELETYRIDGTTNLKLSMSGDLDQPILNGELSLFEAGLDLKNDLRIGKFSGQIKIRDNNLEIKRLDGLLGTALVSVEGKISNLFAPIFDLNISGVGLNYNEFDLPVLAGLNIGSDINFKGKIIGKLWSPKISGELQVNRLEYQDYRTENIKATIGWDIMSNSLQISKLAGDIGGGSFIAKGAFKINSKGVEWKASADITELKLGQFNYASELGINGRISTNALLKGEWKRGEPFEPGIILGTFKGECLSNPEFYLKDIQGVYSWEQGKLKIDSIQARSGEGRFYGHLAWDTQNLTANFNAEHIPIRNILPDDKKYPIDGIFDGVFEFKGPLSDIKGKIHCSLKQGAYLSKPVGEITGSLEYEDLGLNIVDLHLAADSGDYNIKGRVNWGSEPKIALTVSSFLAKLDGFGEWLPIDPSLRLGGTGSLELQFSGSMTNPSYVGLINLINPSIGTFQMEQGIVQFEGDFQEIHLKRMELRDNSSSIEISGKATRDNLDLDLACNQISLDDFNLNYKGNRLQGMFNLTGKLTGKPDNPVLSAEIRSGDVNFGPFSGNISSGNFVWKEQQIQLSRIKLDGEDFAFNIYGKINISQPLMVDLGISVDNLNLTKLVQIFDLSGIDVKGSLGGLIKLTGALFQPEIKVHGEFIDTTLSTVPIQGEFELNYFKNRLDIEQIKLRQDMGSLVASGVLEVGSALNLRIKALGFSLEMFNSFLDPGHKLAGIVDIDTDLKWSKTEISGELTANTDELFLNQIRLGDLQLRGKFTEQGFSLEESLLNTKGGYLIAQGFLPWPDQIFSRMGFPSKPSQSLDLELVLKNTPVAIINSYLPQDILINSGEMDGKINLNGLYGSPIITGEIEASNIGINTPFLPLPIENAQMITAITNNRILIKQARGRYGEGKFTLDGETILFDKEGQLHFDLNFIGSDIYYRNNYFDGFTDLDLKLTGTANNSKISGEVKVFKSKIGILKVTKIKPSNVKWNPKFDLRVKTGKNVRYRQVGLADILVRSNLQIEGDFKNPLISGEAISSKGVLTLYGQTFKINKAEATFDYSHGINPYVEVDSSVLTAKNEVFLVVKGQIGGDLSINLYSYPSLSEEELFALLNWSELRGDKPFSVQEAANTNLSMITDTMFGEVFYELRQALHLDYLYLERDYIQDEFRINIGDFVSNDLFLSYSRSVSEEPKEKWGLDYHLTSHLITGGTYSIEEGTSWRLTYRFRF